MGFYVFLFFCLTSIWALTSAGTSSLSNDIPNIQESQSQIKNIVDNAMARVDMISYIAFNLATTNPTFYRPNRTDGLYYYQAIRIDVYTSGTYSFISNSSIDTFGYLYAQSFNPSNPNANVIAFDDDSGGNGNQFRINKNLQYGITYILVVTTYATTTTDRVGVIASGPDSVILTLFRPDTIGTTISPISSTSFPTTYAGSLSFSSPSFYRYPQTDGLYFYQALRITISTPGRYTFISVSTLDTYGYLYSSSMDPSYPGQNLLGFDDDGAGAGQFRISYDFRSSGTYVLIVTTYAAGQRGSFTIQASGPAYVYLTAFTPSTSRPIQTSTTTTTLSPSLYYGSLWSSQYFYRPTQSDGYYYYEALRFRVSTTGSYRFTSSSSMDTFGLLYNSPFDPSYSSLNLITSDDDGGGSRQFTINSYLQSGQTYVLVVTTYAPRVSGSYSIYTSGPQSISLSSFTPSTSRPIQTTTSYSYHTSPTLSTMSIVGIVLGCIFLLAIFVSVVSYANKQRVINHRRVNQTPGTRTVVRNGTAAPYTIPMHSVYIHSVEEPPPTYDQAAAYLKASQH